jgi:hypothetical protein
MKLGWVWRGYSVSGNSLLPGRRPSCGSCSHRKGQHPVGLLHISCHIEKLEGAIFLLDICRFSCRIDKTHSNKVIFVMKKLFVYHYSYFYYYGARVTGLPAQV